MHKTFLKIGPAALLGFGMMLSVAQAQDQPAGPPAGRRGQPMDPEQQLQRMRQQFQLSDDQVSQIRPILADAQKQVMALRSDTTVAPEDRRAKMQSIRQDSAAKVRGLLNDTQKAQYDEMLAKRQQMNQERRDQPPAGAPPSQPNQ